MWWEPPHPKPPIKEKDGRLISTWNWDEDELVDFIEKYGEQKFKTVL